MAKSAAASVLKVTGTTVEQLTVKFKTIFVPEDVNMRGGDRTKAPKCISLAAHMKVNGQLEPVIVRNGGPKSQPWVLVAGYNRMAAYLINGWEDREINITVREYQKGDVLGPLVDNWAENMEREAPSAFDQATRVHQFLTGTYPVGPNEVATPVSKETTASILNMSKRQVEKLAKVVRDLDPSVAKKTQSSKDEVPSWLVISLSQIAGEGKDEEAQLENRAAQQMKTLEAWLESKAELERAGRQRAERSDKGGKAKKKKKVEEEDEGAVDLSKPIGKKERTVEDLLACLSFFVVEKLAKETPESALQVETAIHTIEVLMGARASLGFLTEADWKTYQKATAEDVDGDEDGDEEG